MKSPVLIGYLTSIESKELIIADFASGEHDRVPSFFVNLLPKEYPSISLQTIVYCADSHALRLDSLMGKLEESGLLDHVRIIEAKLETMDETAILRPDMVAYLERNSEIMTALDRHLQENKTIPPESFDLGVLNNDVIGYLHEYYKDTSDVSVGLQKVQQTLKKGALLVVTMPCSLYVADNIKILENLGFRFLDGKDVILADGSVSTIDRDTEPQKMSRLGHYTFLIFIRN